MYYPMRKRLTRFVDDDIAEPADQDLYNYIPDFANFESRAPSAVPKPAADDNVHAILKREKERYANRVAAEQELAEARRAKKSSTSKIPVSVKPKSTPVRATESSSLKTAVATTPAPRVATARSSDRSSAGTVFVEGSSTTKVHKESPKEALLKKKAALEEQMAKLQAIQDEINLFDLEAEEDNIEEEEGEEEGEFEDEGDDVEEYEEESEGEEDEVRQYHAASDSPAV